MKIMNCYTLLGLSLAGLFLLQGCDAVEKKSVGKIKNYERFRDSVLAENRKTAPDTSNIFDDEVTFRPGTDSADTLLIALDTMLRREISLVEKVDTLIKRLKKMESYSPEEKEKLQENIKMLDSFLLKSKPEEKITCHEKDCYLYVEIIKSRQMLFLHIDGELKDSFPVSTGIKKHATPNLNVRPSGPIFTRYTSRKWPGGDYKGLGNMPYAVFIKGGYAIHGTTPGNYSKLGTVASHGCIRLHPDNAIVLYELIKLIGLSDTWVSVRDSL